MTKRTLRFFLTLSIIFFASCTNHTNQFLLDDYREAGSGSSVALLTIDLEVLYPQFPDHNFGALRPAEKNVFDKQLPTLLSRQTKTPVHGKLDHQILEELPFQIRDFKLKNRTLEILSPQTGALLENDGIHPQFIIVLDQFRFTPYEIEVGGGTYAGHESEVENRMRFETRYIIWDNERREAIAWGDIQSSQILNFDDMTSTYNQLISSAFSKIVGTSPLARSVSK